MHMLLFSLAEVEKKNFLNEKRILIDSPNVPTYDLKPDMSADSLTDRLIKEINNDEHDDYNSKLRQS